MGQSARDVTVVERFGSLSTSRASWQSSLSSTLTSFPGTACLVSPVCSGPLPQTNSALAVISFYTKLLITTITPVALFILLAIFFLMPSYIQAWRHTMHDEDTWRISRANKKKQFVKLCLFTVFLLCTPAACRTWNERAAQIRQSRQPFSDTLSASRLTASTIWWWISICTAATRNGTRISPLRSSAF